MCMQNTSTQTVIQHKHGFVLPSTIIIKSCIIVWEFGCLTSGLIKYHVKFILK